MQMASAVDPPKPGLNEICAVEDHSKEIKKKKEDKRLNNKLRVGLEILQFLLW